MLDFKYFSLLNLLQEAILPIWLRLHIHDWDTLFPALDICLELNLSNSLWSLMWPIYLLFNKILKTGDERELRGDHLNAIDPYLFQQSSSNIDSHPPSLLCSQLPEVRACDLWLKTYSLLSYQKNILYLKFI